MSDKKKKPKHVLLIWAEIPEDISYFLIPLEELEKKQRLWLRRCHGNYLNASETVFNGKYTQKQIDEALIMVCELVADPNSKWLADDPEYFKRQAEQYEMEVDAFAQMHGSWYQHKLPLTKPASIPRCRIVQSGMIL